MRAFAMTGIVTASWISLILEGSAIRATPPSLRMSAGTRSSAMTATAPASSAIRASSAVVTSMITPPFNISARPLLTRMVASSDMFTILAVSVAESPAFVAELSACDAEEKIPPGRPGRPGGRQLSSVADRARIRTAAMVTGERVARSRAIPREVERFFVERPVVGDRVVGRIGSADRGTARDENPTRSERRRARAVVSQRHVVAQRHVGAADQSDSDSGRRRRTARLALAGHVVVENVIVLALPVGERVRVLAAVDEDHPGTVPPGPVVVHATFARVAEQEAEAFRPHVSERLVPHDDRISVR